MPQDLDSFSYALSEKSIARRPPQKRDGGKLLDARCSPPRITAFSELPSFLRKGDVAVVNDSKVIPARLSAVKESGGRAEIFAERFLPDGEVLAQVRASKSPAVGAKLFAGGGVWIVREKMADGFFRLRAENRGGKKVAARPRFIRRGQTPLPPYIRRAADDNDKLRYQTIFARNSGSVAAPTAGLHFTAETFAKMAARGVGLAKITLHIGAGTFLPLRGGLRTKSLHRERYTISRAAAAKINAAKQNGGRILAVGTTTLRALESAAIGGELSAQNTETDLFIKPGFAFRIADLLLTNFHLPRSSLLVLACAFGGREKVLRACRFAARRGLRFYSYGDAMLLSRAK